MREPRDYSLLQAAEQIRRGRLTAEALMLSCLERIEARQQEVRAWAFLDAGQALEQARMLDQEAASRHWRGPLHGIPIGIKDIIDVKGMETRGGTEAWPGGVAKRDALCVARLRESGAIILGKLATTPFAFRDPAETRNPWNTAYSPGGSSAGSGAAVADRMCLAALGTQTGGSVLRPASFNGIVGFKPTHGSISTEGVIPLCPNLDHVGVLTRTVLDAATLWSVMRVDAQQEWKASREKMTVELSPRMPDRLWRVRGFFEDEADPACLEQVEKVCAKLSASGVRIVEKSLPGSFGGLTELYQMLVSAEAAAAHEPWFDDRKHLYPEHIRATIEGGREIRAAEYLRGLAQREQMRREIREALSDVDGAIMPTTVTPPPDPSSTGSARFNLPWSICGIPALSLPAGLDRNGLPLGVQLVSGKGKERSLLQLGGWVESRIGFAAQPD